jgi:hypothetical protein
MPTVILALTLVGCLAMALMGLVLRREYRRDNNNDDD